MGDATEGLFHTGAAVVEDVDNARWHRIKYSAFPYSFELCLQASGHHNTLLAALQDCQNPISGPMAVYTMVGFCQGLTQLGEGGCRQYDPFCTTEGFCLVICLLNKCSFET